MYSCDYNGWADVPEEEREGIDIFEAVRPPTTPLPSMSASLELSTREFRVVRPGLELARRKAA